MNEKVERDPDILFEDYVQILRENCDDPRLSDLATQIQNHGYTIRMPPEEQREASGDDNERYRYFIVNVYLIDDAGETIISRRQLEIRKPLPPEFNEKLTGSFDQGFLKGAEIYWDKTPPDKKVLAEESLPLEWDFTEAERHALHESLKRHWNDVLLFTESKNKRLLPYSSFSLMLQSATVLAPGGIESVVLPFLVDLEIGFLDRFDADDVLDCGCLALDHAEALLEWQIRNLYP